MGEHIVEVVSSDEAILVVICLEEDVLHLLVTEFLLKLKSNLSKLLHINFTLNSKPFTL